MARFKAIAKVAKADQDGLRLRLAAVSLLGLGLLGLLLLIRP